MWKKTQKTRVYYDAIYFITNHDSPDTICLLSFSTLFHSSFSMSTMFNFVLLQLNPLEYLHLSADQHLQVSDASASSNQNADVLRKIRRLVLAALINIPKPFITTNNIDCNANYYKNVFNVRDGYCCPGVKNPRSAIEIFSKNTKLKIQFQIDFYFFYHLACQFPRDLNFLNYDV